MQTQTAVNPANRQEAVAGRLLQFYGEWKVQSGYGTFPLSKQMAEKCTTEHNGAWVSGWVRAGIVEHFHFEDEAIDG